MIRRFLHRWHRRFGIATAFIIILLAVSGVLLNHTTELKLGQYFINSNWLLNWYDIRPDRPATTYQSGDMNIVLMGDRLFANTHELRGSFEKLHGVLGLNDVIIIGVDDLLLLLNEQGFLMEQLDGMDGIPSGMRRLGLDTNNRITIQAAHGDYHLDLERLCWEEISGTEIQWSRPVPISDDLQSKILSLYRGRGLSLERILLDLHSGRILGGWGIWLVDLAALCLLFLTVTGIWIWLYGWPYRR